MNCVPGGGGGGGGKTGPFQKFGNMMSGMAKGGLDFLTSIPMKLTNIIGAKVRFIQGIGQAKMQFLGNIGNKFTKGRTTHIRRPHRVRGALLSWVHGK